MSERDVLDALARHYSAPSQGRGYRYAFADHVRNAASFYATRTADFIAMDTWTSGGLALHGHEVKISRSDWLTELKDPTKAEAFKQYMDRWWLVVPDESIVKGDLPEGWGLKVVVDGRVITKKQAPKLNPLPVPKSMLAPLLRSVASTAKYHARENGVLV